MNKDQVKGRVKVAKGKAKEVAGKLLHQPGLIVRGRLQEAAGKTQATYGDVKSAVTRDHHHHRHHHPHERGHGITLVGLAHGLAGTTAVVALVPVTMVDRVTVGLGYLVAFGLGVTVAMTLFASISAVAMKQAAERSLALGRRITSLVGGAGILTGVFWVWRALSP